MMAIVRIRGNVNRRHKLRGSLDIMGLSAPNNCIIAKDSPSLRGLLQKVKDSVAFGDIELETLTLMLKKRGRLEGNKRIDETTVKETGYSTVDDLAKALFEGKVAINSVPNLKPVFRLTPPSKGFKSVMKSYPDGDLGSHGAAIKDLIKRMI